MTPTQIEEITQLRSRNVSPKQIARKLGLRPAEVTAIIKQQFAAGNIQKALPALKAVLIDEASAQTLLGLSPNKGLLGKINRSDVKSNGLSQIFILRVDDRNHHWVSSYLIDCWCLGIKDTLGPRQVTLKQYERMVEETEERFGQNLREITLEQALSVVYGAEDYARGLGFEPHSDFRRSRAHLGPRPDPLIDIEFGKDGKPFYISGPYDNPEKIMATLQKSMGEGNFDYIAGIGPPDEFF
ncbi:MAG: DNA-binding response regulator [Cyanobacteria bacterium P01_F01_bin.150]